MSSLLTENPPIIVFDLDGTLINEHKGVHPMDVTLLTMPDPPAVFVPATGRSMYTMRRILQEFGILNGKPIPFSFICQNGSFIYDQREKQLQGSTFEPDLQEELLSICKKMSGVCFLLFDENDLQILHPTSFGLQETDRFRISHREYRENDSVVRYSKMMCLSPDPEVFLEFISLVKGLDIEIATSTPTILEFNPTGISKGSSLEVLAEYKHWSKGNIFCAGDGENDLSMFSKFENSFAPKTCAKYIQEKAANIIDTLEYGLLTPILEYAAAKINNKELVHTNTQKSIS